MNHLKKKLIVSSYKNILISIYLKKTSSIVVQDIPIPFIQNSCLFISNILNKSGN